MTNVNLSIARETVDNGYEALGATIDWISELEAEFNYNGQHEFLIMDMNQELKSIRSNLAKDVRKLRTLEKGVK